MRKNTILAGVGGAAVMGAVLGIGYLLFKGGPDPQPGLDQDVPLNHRRSFESHLLQPRDQFAGFLDGLPAVVHTQMRGESKDLLTKLLVKAIHHGDNDDQDGDADNRTKNGEEHGDGNEGTARLQVPQSQKHAGA